MPELADRLITFYEDLLPEMVQLKYDVMAANAFRFFRGSCHVFYERPGSCEITPALTMGVDPR